MKYTKEYKQRYNELISKNNQMNAEPYLISERQLELFILSISIVCIILIIKW